VKLFAVLLVVAVPGATRPGGDATEEEEWEEANRSISLSIAAGRDNTGARRTPDA
jgi:hypothetical protein